MNQPIPKPKRTSNLERVISFKSHLSNRLVNEIDEFENDDALTSNNITVSSFRSTGKYEFRDSTL